MVQVMDSDDLLLAPNDIKVATWGFTLTLAVDVGVNSIPITVTAPNAVTVRYYTLAVNVLGDTRLLSLDTVPAGAPPALAVVVVARSPRRRPVSPAAPDISPSPRRTSRASPVIPCAP